MEISGFCAAAGKRLGVEFTVSLFHVVKLNFELLRLGVLSSWITFPSGDDVKARCEVQTAAHFIKINKVRFSVLRCTHITSLLSTSQEVDKRRKLQEKCNLSSNLEL